MCRLSVGLVGVVNQLVQRHRKKTKTGNSHVFYHQRKYLFQLYSRLQLNFRSVILVDKKMLFF